MDAEEAEDLYMEPYDPHLADTEKIMQRYAE